jgi:hypothetical protein
MPVPGNRRHGERFVISAENESEKSGCQRRSGGGELAQDDRKAARISRAAALG